MGYAPDLAIGWDPKHFSHLGIHEIYRENVIECYRMLKMQTQMPGAEL